MKVSKLNDMLNEKVFTQEEPLKELRFWETDSKRESEEKIDEIKFLDQLKAKAQQAKMFGQEKKTELTAQNAAKQAELEKQRAAAAAQKQTVKTGKQTAEQALMLSNSLKAIQGSLGKLKVQFDTAIKNSFGGWDKITDENLKKSLAVINGGLDAKGDVLNNLVAATNALAAQAQGQVKGAYQAAKAAPATAATAAPAPATAAPATAAPAKETSGPEVELSAAAE